MLMNPVTCEPQLDVMFLSEPEFEQCLRIVLPGLATYARALTRDPDMAQDLVQETAIKAWSARRRFVAGTNFKAWSYHILRNCFLSYLRHQRVARTVSGGDDLPEIPVAPAQELSLNLQDVARRWELLTADQQRSLTLVALDGYSYEEAATIAKVPLGTMKSRVARAREALLAMLNEEPCLSAGTQLQTERLTRMPAAAAAQDLPPATKAVDCMQVDLLRVWRERRRMVRLAA